MGAYRVGKTRVGRITGAVIILAICAVAVAVLGKNFSLSDYWEFITYVIIVVLAIIGEVL